MKKTIGNLLKIVFLAAAVSTAAYASHDNGPGKSQDGDGDDALHSISVAPEPSAFWLFLTGTLMIAALSRFKKKQIGN